MNGQEPLTAGMIEALWAVAHGAVSMSWSQSFGIHASTHRALESRGLVESGEPVADQHARLMENPARRRYAIVLTDAGRLALEGTDEPAPNDKEAGPHG